MNKKILKHIDICFSKLIKKHGFVKRNEVNTKDDYSIEFWSDTFMLKIEKYRRDFQPTLFSSTFKDKGISLFNLFRFLEIKFSEFNYYHNELSGEKELEEYYKKQISYISDLLYKNLSLIQGFFDKPNFKSRLADINAFMIKEYPYLFKKR